MWRSAVEILALAADLEIAKSILDAPVAAIDGEQVVRGDVFTVHEVGHENPIGPIVVAAADEAQPSTVSA